MNMNELKRRRETLIKLVGKNNVAYLYSASAKNRNSDVDHPFRQDSNFLYLTGFKEPNSLAVFIPGRGEGEFVMFCKEYSKEKATWDGAVVGLDGVVAEYDADQAFPFDDAEEILKELTGDRPVVEIEEFIHDMRVIKSPYEIFLMRIAADISCQAHRRAILATRPDKCEYEIESEIIHEGFKFGIRECAYPSIVAGGANACVLHYVENKDVLKDGDLLLIDAGLELDGYASDITRTFPVNGKFSEAQKEIYQIVLDSQLATIALIKPGATFDELYKESARIIQEGLEKLGILTGELILRDFYMHGVSHYLGMDVHDVGERGELRVGMALTVEPGIYIPDDLEAVEEKYRGIGIRIEDDIVVTEDGSEVLSHSLIKEIDDIEKLMENNNESI
jgi:Xaa-Pro aminopeptidase